MNNKDTLLLHASIWHQVRLLNDEQAGMIFKAMLCYVLEGTEPEFTELAMQIVWEGIKSQIDDNNAKYEAKCKTNSENRRKGYAKKNTTVNDGIQNIQPNTTVNDGVNRKPNDMECSDMVSGDMSSNTTFVSSDKSSEKKCVCEQDETHTRTRRDFLEFQQIYKKKCSHLAESDMKQPTEEDVVQMLKVCNNDAKLFWRILYSMENKRETVTKYNSVPTTFMFWRETNRYK